MQNKKLTLQQYIECYNIKKQLRERSKQKSRSKSRDRAASQGHIPIDHHDASLLSITRSKDNNKISSHQMLGATIYDQVDFRARNLYHQLQQTISDIKLECRAIIKNDKEFAFFIKLMDSLLNKFRSAVMHIHRENLLLFQMSRQADKTVSTDRDDLARTHIENLQKSFNEQYELSKSQFESNLNFVPHKTIKQKMQENSKGQQMLKAIFGGMTEEPSKEKKMLKKYDTDPKDERERQQRKQEAVGFLGFIMKNIASSKKNNPTSLPTDLSPNPASPESNMRQLNATSPNSNAKSQPNINSFFLNMISPANQASPLKSETVIPEAKKLNQKKLVSKPKAEDDEIVKHINYLNSNTKTKINTEVIDNVYNDQNFSFQVHSPPTKSSSKLKAIVPKSPTKITEKPNKKLLTKKQSEKEEKKEAKVSEEKHLQRKKVIQRQSPTPPLSNSIQLIHRTSTKSKQKNTKLSVNKKKP